MNTGTPPLTRFVGLGKNSVKGKPHYRRSILVLEPQNGEYESPKSTFLGLFNFQSPLFEQSALQSTNKSHKW